MSLFSAVEMAPRDPILGLNEQFNADTNPSKVNLGVGVYFDDNGKLPLLQCVQAAEKAMMDKPTARGYLPIDGIAAYDAAVKSLVFGADSEPVTSRPRRHGAGHWRHRRPEDRRRLPEEAQPQRQGADLRPELGKPPRAVHQRRLRGRNLPLLRRRQARHRLRRHAGRPERRRAGTIVVLHACCHNPTGYDITRRPVGPGDRRRQGQRAWCPSSTWPTRASATALPKTAR